MKSTQGEATGRWPRTINNESVKVCSVALLRSSMAVKILDHRGCKLCFSQNKSHNRKTKCFPGAPIGALVFS